MSRSDPSPAAPSLSQRRPSHGGLPRAVDALAAAVGLVATLPLLLLLAVAIRFTSPGPVLFRQIRVGRDGQPFELLKFRTMRIGPPVGPSPGASVTVGGDRRVTAIGAILRRTKLDELPELLNVLRGEMALVGPRPEVPDYVDPDDPSWRRLLQRRPGLTHETSLLLRAEEEVLRLGIERTGLDTERFYRDVLLPFKLRHALEAEGRRTVLRDLRTLLATGVALVKAPVRPEVLLERILAPTEANQNEVVSEATDPE